MDGSIFLKFWNSEILKIWMFEISSHHKLLPQFTRVHNRWKFIRLSLWYLSFVSYQTVLLVQCQLMVQCRTRLYRSDICQILFHCRTNSSTVKQNGGALANTRPKPLRGSHETITTVLPCRRNSFNLRKKAKCTLWSKVKIVLKIGIANAR